MANERFSKLGNTEVLVIEKDKTAVIIELQQGKADSEHFELVLQEMYYKDDNWAYCRGGVRVPCNVDGANFIIKGVKAMFEIGKTKTKDVKPVKTSKIDVKSSLDTFTADEKAELLKLLLAESSTTTTASAKKTPKKDPEPEKSAVDELILEFFAGKQATKRGNKK